MFKTSATIAAMGAISRVAGAADDPLPSWNEGASKKAIVDFVHVTTDQSSPNFVPSEARIATFDQDGTTWVEHPMYSQLQFSADRVTTLSPQHPEWSTNPLLATGQDLETIEDATQISMPVSEFQSLVHNWMATAKHPRFNRPYAQMVYQPMLEVMKYLRDNGYRTFIVTGGGQEFVRVYSQQVYGVPTDQVIGSALETEYEYAKDGRPYLERTKSLLLNNNNAGKAKDIYLFLGKRPHAAFGNSTGDQQMLEYTQGVGGASLQMLVLHDDAQREYAYGPAQGLPDTHIGKFTQALYDEAKQRGWSVISMKNDWNLESDIYLGEIGRSRNLLRASLSNANGRKRIEIFAAFEYTCVNS